MATMNKDVQAIHGRESDFHDEWASSTPLDKIQVRECFESLTAQENRFILEKMGSLTGKKILDIGTGLGESAVYFALKGAEVTATDLSPEMIKRTLQLAEYHGVEVEGRVQAAEKLEVAPGSYDFVYVANTLHHVTNRAALLEQIREALKPGGVFFSWDPIAYNPVINQYRRMAMEVRTIDEAPLTFDDLPLFRKYFQNVRHREFWIATLSLFLKYYLVDRVDPNKTRYWKRIFDETPASLRWWRPLLALDAVLTRIPGMKRMAWNMVVWGEREQA